MIRCTNFKCQFNHNNKCQGNNVLLEFKGVNTKNQGFQEYLKCNSYEVSEEAKFMDKFLMLETITGSEWLSKDKKGRFKWGIKQ